MISSGRLISLLEIMRRFAAALFVSLSSLLDALAFEGRNDPRKVMSEDRRAKADALLADFEPDCIELELTTSLVTIQKIRRLLAQIDCEHGTLAALVEELQGRLIDEMRGKSYWALSMKEAEYYNHPLKGWEEIVDRFPDTISDVEEAQKCFALSRYAASVFHSLQVVETGLIALGEFIGVADPKSGWTAVANELEKIATKKYQDRTDFEKQNFEFLEQVRATVEALKNAWRNKISHVHRRLVLMTADFSPEVAEEILVASRAFMRRLATGLPAANS